MINEILEGTVIASAGLLAYHHIGYPGLMALSGQRAVAQSRGASKVTDYTPSVSIIMPAYNEAAYIEGKIDAIANLSYPKDKITVLIGSDGSTDDTVARARNAAARHPHLRATIIDYPVNRGKIRVINDLLASASGHIAIFTDVSAIPEQDAIRKTVAYFGDASVGAVGGGYSLSTTASFGERLYWKIQRSVKVGESRWAGLIGAHGAFYAIRRQHYTPLETDTINDDFIIPMRIAIAGFRTIYDPEITVREMEHTSEKADWNRRTRIGAGNLQQVLRLGRAFSLSQPGMALCFASGKGLRCLCPVLLLLLLLGITGTAGNGPAMAVIALLALLGSGFALFGPAAGKLGRLSRYILLGHVANFVGAVRYVFGPSTGWSGRVTSPTDNAKDAGNAVRTSKRLVDILGALVGLALTAPLFPIVALAIKLESPGPIFFRQMRVGRVRSDRTELFEMIKFRSMRADAEKKSGPAWAQKNDPRVTRVGQFIRKTRLDELPQFLNVLRGDMSLIGPRPERPGFCRALDQKIPFYIERTYDIRPGITGLAQVRQGYDETLDDVRRKLMYDHSYAASIGRIGAWLRMDLTIIFETIFVMAFGRGR